jgi:hypothetical protein
MVQAGEYDTKVILGCLLHVMIGNRCGPTLAHIGIHVCLCYTAHNGERSTRHQELLWNNDD